MRAEIQQVLKMNREGTLTDEQATELLAELVGRAGEAGDRQPEGTGAGATGTYSAGWSRCCPR